MPYKFQMTSGTTWSSFNKIHHEWFGDKTQTEISIYLSLGVISSHTAATTAALNREASQTGDHGNNSVQTLGNVVLNQTADGLSFLLEGVEGSTKHFLNSLGGSSDLLERSKVLDLNLMKIKLIREENVKDQH